MQEIWKPITGYEGLYSVSNMGRVKSHERYTLTSHGVKRKVFEKILKPMTDKAKRQQVSLCKDFNVKIIRVHHLVLREFVGPIPNGMERCHNDGNASNNCLENLRYDTAQNNQKDKILHGVTNRGQKAFGVKLCIDDVVAIKTRLKNGERGCKIAKDYPVNHQQISRIKQGKEWGYIQV